MAEIRLKEVLAFVNHKGGVGKTTSVQSLATGLRRYGKGYFGKGEDGKERKPRVLLIDLDPQSSLSFLFGWSEVQNPGKPTVYDALIKQSPLPVYQVEDGIHLIPASANLIGIEPFLNQMTLPRKALTKLLAKPFAVMQDYKYVDKDGKEAEDEFAGKDGMKVEEVFDYILIDCPPAMSLLTHNALSCATSVVIPVQLEMLATKGIAEILNAVKETREDLNPNLDIRGLLMVMSNDQTKATRQFKEYLGDKFDDYMFDAYTRRDTKMVEAQAMSKDIFTYAPYSRVGNDYEAFTKEILASMPK